MEQHIQISGGNGRFAILLSVLTDHLKGFQSTYKINMLNGILINIIYRIIFKMIKSFKLT